MENHPLVLEGKTHDLGGGMIVSRILPQAKRRMLGPFVFFDHMGPFVAKANQNIDVRPHPHIGLSTLTYLFEGRIVHRDSLGSVATILPGEVNWMTAGKGISHSERSHAEDKYRDRAMHGLQFWIALPDRDEEIEPSFQHYSKAQIPRQENSDFDLELIAGSGFGLTSNVKVSSPLLLARVTAKRTGTMPIHMPGFDIGVYVLNGSLGSAGTTIKACQMLVLPKDAVSLVEFSANADFLILGGEPFATPRHIWWNLVSSSKERIERAKQEWKSGAFPMVPGETEYIPAPDS